MSTHISDTSVLGNFGRHTPKVLRRQLIFQLAEQYLGENQNNQETTDQAQVGNECRPSIQRFHGALLFVDISGFTALSLRLSVEELKNHINEYFTTMLDIVDKFGGDVIKFAGDALFIIWETGLIQHQQMMVKSTVSSFENDVMSAGREMADSSSSAALNTLSARSMTSNHGNPSQPNGALTPPKLLMKESNDSDGFKAACKIALDKAVECGREISAVCGNHKVLLTQKVSAIAVKPPVTPSGKVSTPKSGGTSMFRMLLPSLGNILSLGQSSANSSSSPSLSPIREQGGGGGLTSVVAAAVAAAEEENNVAYLNVHSGVSMGLMAGIDIGANDRWEYFLVGSPLSEVATAEGLAHTGDVVISPEAHAVLHPPPGIQVASPNAKKQRRVSAVGLRLVAANNPSSSHPSKALSVSTDMEWACSCIKLEHGFCRVAPRNSPVNVNRKSRVKAKMEDIMNLDDAFNKDMQFLEALNSEIGDAYSLHAGAFRREIVKQGQSFEANLSSPNTSRQDRNDSSDLTIASEGNQVGFPMESRNNSVVTADVDVSTNEPFPSEFAPTRLKVDADRAFPVTEETIRHHFNKWMHSCLADDLARHVHDVARNDYILKDVNRNDALKKEIEHQILHVKRSSRISKIKIDLKGRPLMVLDPSNPNSINSVSSIGLQMTSQSSPSTPTSAELTAMQSSRSNSNMNTRGNTSTALTPLRKKSSSRRIMENKDASALIAEIRQVTVLFVKIDMPNMELLVDAFRGASKMVGGEGKFLAKTVNESIADQLLLDRLQICMEALTTAFSNNGGQMRQFIVDDKGTVCIGTFGLRGSVSDDNAAAALETAKMIVDKLQAIGLNSSIGVTVGRAYCGLVGSAKRHEYAVMGPSTNLSARLMCKAPPCGILCDIETRNRDRTHTFQTLAHIVAKGYKDPVGTFMPLFQSVNDFMSGGMQRSGSDARLMTRASFDFYCNDGNAVVLSALKKMNSNTHLRKEGSNSNISVTSSKFNAFGNHQNRVIRQMLRANFYLKSDSNMSTSASALISPRSNVLKTSMSGKVNQSKLHGRKAEIEIILVFLFEKVVEVAKALSKEVAMSRENSHSSSLADAASVPIFLLTEPARFVGITAAQGMGKSALVASLTQQIFTVANTDPNINIHMFRTRYNSFQVSVPFNAWKPIIREMLVRVIRTLGVKAATMTLKQRRRSIVVAGASANNDLVSGADFIVSQLEPHLQKLKPLLGDLGILPEDKGSLEALELTNLEKLSKSSELLLAVIQQYITLTGKLVFITVEDIHTFDLASLSLLHQIWVRVTGIVVLFTGRPRQASNNSPTGIAELSILHPGETSPARAYKRRGSTDARVDGPNQALDFTESFSDHSRYLDVELGKLDRMATALLARDALHKLGVAEIEQHLIDQVCEVSGGNPMYAFELSKSIADQEEDGGGAGVDSSVISKVKAGFHCTRIEEVICHRFDQLDTNAQTVLKMAAVACSNGARFTSALLSFILEDENYDDSTATNVGYVTSASGSYKSTGSGLTLKKNELNVVNALYDILHCEDFIKVCETTKARLYSMGTMGDLYGGESEDRFEMDDGFGSSVKDKRKSAITKEALSNNQFVFEFNIALEQRTIYDLLLDDQKQVIHECVAEFYQSLTENNKMQSVKMDASLHAENYWEESFHFRRAADWTNAMKSAYHASFLETHDMRSNLYLASAYAMYTAMAHHSEGGPSASLSEPTDSGELLVSDVTALFETAFNARPGGYGGQSGMSHKVMSMQRIYQIFGGVSELLEIGLQIHVRMAHRCMSLLEDTTATQQLLEDALQILLHTKNPFLLSSSHLANLMNSMGNPMGIMSNDEYDRPPLAKESYFCVPDFPALCYPLFAAYIQNYLYTCRHTSEQLEKVKYVADKLFELTAADGKDKLHYIQALMLQVQLQHKLGRIAEASILFDELLVAYRTERHSAGLIRTYGSDRMPVVLALMSQTLFLSGEKATQHIQTAVTMVLESQHTSSVAMAVMRIVSVLTFLRRYEAAMQVFAHYLVLKERDSAVHDQIVDDVDSVYLEWISRLVKYQTFLRDGDALNFHDDSQDVDAILQVGGISQTKDSSDRTHIYDYLCTQGRGLESVFADMCAIKIAILCKQKANPTSALDFPDKILKIYCDAAIIYVKHSFAVECDGQHQVAFNGLNAVITLSQIMNTVSGMHVRSGEVVYSTLFKGEFVKDPSLSAMKVVASEHKMHFASLVMSLFHKQLHGSLEDERALSDTLEKLHNAASNSHSGGGWFAELQELLKQSMPVSH